MSVICSMYKHMYNKHHRNRKRRVDGPQKTFEGCNKVNLYNEKESDFILEVSSRRAH